VKLQNQHGVAGRWEGTLTSGFIPYYQTASYTPHPYLMHHFFFPKARKKGRKEGREGGREGGREKEKERARKRERERETRTFTTLK
jgi:hypothetical protein